MSETVQREEDTQSGEVLVEVDELKTYYESGGLLTDEPVKAVDGVNLRIERGETLGLVGESGCGKTTLGRTLVQLEAATAGEVSFDGTDVTRLSGDDLKNWRRNAQIVFQDPESSLNDRMTVGEIVREPLDVHDWPTLSVAVLADGETRVEGAMVREAGSDATGREVDLRVRATGSEPSVEVSDGVPLTADDLDVEVDHDGETTTVTVTVGKSKPQMRRQRVRELLETVGLQEEHYYRYPHQFSGGQRQRIGIARALAVDPEFLVLDEPVSALDVSVQAKILNLLEDLQEEFGLTYLFIAHDLSVVRHICDRVAVMYLGNIMEVGPGEELFSDPANPYTHALLSAIPEPDPGSEKDRITLRGTPPSPRDPPTGCPFSTRCPAKIRPEAYRDTDDDLWNRIEVLREILRERDRADRTLSERARSLLGMETRFSDIDEIIREVFGEPETTETGTDATGTNDADEDDTEPDPFASLPPEVRGEIERAAEHVRSGDAQAAREYLTEEFGSECDTEMPAHHEVSQSGRVSLCHRHKADHEEPDEFFTHTIFDER